jgi:hypothetical protein
MSTPNIMPVQEQQASQFQALIILFCNQTSAGSEMKPRTASWGQSHTFYGGDGWMMSPAGTVVISGGWRNLEKNRIYCYFFHHESHTKSPETEPSLRGKNTAWPICTTQHSRMKLPACSNHNQFWYNKSFYTFYRTPSINWETSVGIATKGYWLEGRGSTPGRDKRFFCTPHRQRSIQPSIQCVPRHFPRR